MRIAILADIHSNNRALSEVLRHARAAKVDQLIILGDIVGYYYEAKEVLDSLRPWPVIAIRGNHERWLGRAFKDENVAQKYCYKFGSALKIALRTLSSEQIAWLTSLPDRATISIEDVKLELCHGSPRDMDEYVYPDADPNLIEACLMPERDFVLTGHTHYPMTVVAGGTCLLNPGSVGQARDVGGFASWCLFDSRTRALRYFRTAYDVMSLVKEVEAMDSQLPELASVLVRNNPFIGGNVTV